MLAYILQNKKTCRLFVGKNGTLTLIPKTGWKVPKDTYRFLVYLLEEEPGGYSVESATLPGVASQGDTEKEALANIVEAFEGTLASYKAHHEPIPKLEEPRVPEKGAVKRWVVVHG